MYSYYEILAIFPVLYNISLYFVLCIVVYTSLTPYSYLVLSTPLPFTYW